MMPLNQNQAAQMRRGYAQESLSFKSSLLEYPAADEILKMIELNKNLMTADTCEKLKMFVHACANKDAVLSNFPTMNDVKIYKIEHRIASLILKISIPRIDSENSVFHLILEILEWTSDPRYLRSYQGFERDKMNEERFYNEVNNRVPEPEKKSFFPIGKRE